MLQFLKKPVVLISLIAGVLLPCLAFLVLHFSQPAARPLVLADAVYISNEPLPATDLIELNGNPVAPDRLRKGKVLLVFFTTDCPACRKELTLLSQVESTLATQVTVYGVGVQDRNQIIDFRNAGEFRTNFIVDKDGQLMRSLHVKYFPARFLLYNGIIMKTAFGNSPSRNALFKEVGL